MTFSEVKVTTTSGFNDVRINEYLEPVTAHVVVGMNLFKDFFGGLTDFFGGKSKTYQNTLSSINTEVIDKLKEKAFALGGNCILSLKIDNDEISAQGKSMMMVSAIGTVAVADFKHNEQLSFNNSFKKKSRISCDQFRILEHKEKYLNEIENGTIQLNDEFWLFAKKYAVIEFADYILKHFIRRFSNPIEYRSEEIQKLFNNTKEYFSTIEQHLVTEMLYLKLNEDISSSAKSELVELIKGNQLIDYTKIITLISNNEFSIKKIGLTLSISEKEFYQKSDIESISTLINQISTSFNERGKKSTKKRALSSKLKEIWICECQNENNIDNQYCSDCKKDIFGFGKKEQNPKDVLTKLKEIKKLLTENL